MVTRILLSTLLAATPSLVLAQPDPVVLADLLALDHAAAVQVIASRSAEVGKGLDALKARFDGSIHSQRDAPEQREVQYDAEALRQGLALGRLYQDGTGDDRYLRMFAARRDRIDGTVLLNQRQFTEAVAKLGSALRQAERLDDVWLQIITNLNMAYGYLELGQMSEAAQSCERARVLSAQSDIRSRALVVFDLASLQMHAGNYDAAVRLSGEAADLARQTGNRFWEGNARLNLGVAHLELGHLVEARAALAEARDVLLQTQDKLGIGRSLYSLALVAASEGDYGEAVQQMERALPLIRSVDIRHSHVIEQKAEHYYNIVEDAALEMLTEWHRALGNEAGAAQYAEALAALRATRPPEAGGHHHKPGGR